MRASRRAGVYNGGKLKFAYTGSYSFLDDGDGDYRLKFLSSGILSVSQKAVIDVFVVGGASGGHNSFDSSGAPGGAGGYTGTWKNITLSAHTAYPVVIGAGGGANTSGGSSSFASAYVKDGAYSNPSWSYNSNGGSGSGAGAYNALVGGNGGTDGGNGGSSNDRPGGTGQGTTTREFGETAGALYAGGGGGGASSYSSSHYGYGGDGGGANGGTYGNNGNSASANTGGGGGGSGGSNPATHYGGSGGSGVVVIRNARAA